jgi:hypothetical protein
MLCGLCTGNKAKNLKPLSRNVIRIFAEFSFCKQLDRHQTIFTEIHATLQCIVYSSLDSAYSKTDHFFSPIAA